MKPQYCTGCGRPHENGTCLRVKSIKEEPLKPWTFEPFELTRDEVWEVFDPNLARVIAVFYDENAADEYLAWVNERQEKKRG